jgi:hypothetical protein
MVDGIVSSTHFLFDHQNRFQNKEFITQCRGATWADHAGAGHPHHEAQTPSRHLGLEDAGKPSSQIAASKARRRCSAAVRCRIQALPSYLLGR